MKTPLDKVGKIGKRGRLPIVAAIALALVAGYFLTAGVSDREVSQGGREAAVVQSSKPLRATPVALNPLVAISSEATEAPAIALKGTAAPGYAVFEDKATGVQSLFKEADAVFGKGLLKAVTDNKAYVESNGRAYVYRIEAPSAGDGVQRVASSVVAAKAPVYPEVLSPLGRRVGKDAWELDRKAVELVLGRFDSVLKDAKLTPSGPGFVVSETRHSGVFGQGGIRDNDVILSVNGLSVSETTNWPKLMAMLDSEESFFVEIIRGNRHRTISYAIR